MKLRAALLALVIASPAAAQSVQQSGTVTRGHVAVWNTSGVIADGGSSSNSPITSFGVTNNGGAGICVNSALPTAPGYNALCLGASTTGAATISLQNYGTAAAQSIQFNINGAVQGFPTVTPLPVVAGNPVCFSNTTGGLTTCGPIPTPTLLNPTIDTSIIWDYSAVLVGSQSVANPSLTSPAGSFISTWAGTTSGGTTALHVIPASGPLVSSTTTEVVTGSTLGQAFGGNYGRWSYSNFFSTASGIVGEYGGTVTPPAYLLQIGIENPPSTFTVYGYWKAVTVDGGAEDVQVGAVQFGQNQPSPGTQQNRLVLLKNNIGAPGTRNSDAILWEGKANNGTERAAWWHQFVNVTSNAGASQFCNQSNLNGAGYVTQYCITDGGIFNVTTGFQIGGVATSGNVLRGNGTNFVSSTVAPGDLSGLGTGVATALGVNIGTAGSFVVNGGALGSPSSAGTIPAFTLGGAISGGGNQINNVIIGTSTPLAGSFTTLSASTSITSPLHYGGSAAGSILGLVSTSNGSPSGDAITNTVAGVEATRLINGHYLLGSTTAQVMGNGPNPNVQIYGASSVGSLGIVRETTPGGGGALVVLASSNSTPHTGAYSALTAGQGLGSVLFGGDTGVSLGVNGATISALATALWTATSSPAAILFGTTPSGSIGTTNALIISPTQNTGIGSNYSATVLPNFNLGLNGQIAFQIGQERETTAATVGNTLTMSAGGAISGGTNLAGGNLILQSGISTGNGTSAVTVKAYPGSAGATADNTATTVASFASGATTLTGTLTVSAIANAATTSSLCYNVGTGLITYDGTVGTCTVSDERLKNMGERIPNALERLLQINGVYYTWKDQALGTGRQIGVGAQTVERVFPELVQTDSNGRKSADYQRLTAPIIEAIRELKADNDVMHAQIRVLQRK